MFAIRKAEERGHLDHGWLNTYHTFSFGRYHDPEHMGFRALRVINEDRVRPGEGFGTHPHRDIEIVTYVLEGAIEHRDSMGNGEVLRPGEIQRMSAGTGITHSEFNPSSETPLHFYQIWLLPERAGITPSYEQKRFAEAGRRNALQLVTSPVGAAGSLTIHQDLHIYLGQLDSNASVTHELANDRHAWLQVLRGRVTLNSVPLGTSDGVAVSDEETLTVTAASDAEVMLFDLA